MLGRLAAAAVLSTLAGCAGMESAGRNSTRAEPAPVASPAPTPAPAPAMPPPDVAAPNLTVPPPAQPRQRASGDDVVVPGQVEQQVAPPAGDPRSTAERMADIRAWDQCVMHAQAATDRDPMRPQLESPEEACRGSLGMASRLSVPDARRQR